MHICLYDKDTTVFQHLCMVRFSNKNIVAATSSDGTSTSTPATIASQHPRRSSTLTLKIFSRQWWTTLLRRQQNMAPVLKPSTLPSTRSHSVNLQWLLKIARAAWHICIGGCRTCSRESETGDCDNGAASTILPIISFLLATPSSICRKHVSFMRTRSSCRQTPQILFQFYSRLFSCDYRWKKEKSQECYSYYCCRSTSNGGYRHACYSVFSNQNTM